MLLSYNYSMIHQALLESLTRYVRLHYQPEVEAHFKPKRAINRADEDITFRNALISEDITTNRTFKKIKVGPTFSNLIMQFINAKNIDTVEFYKSISLSRQLFSKIISHEHYQPTKDTVLKFAIGMKLSLVETNLLLHAASFAFQTSSYRDLYIQAIIAAGSYSPMAVDEILVHFNHDPLFSL